MHILDNTDRWMICLFREGKAVSVMDKPIEKIYEFHGTEYDIFRFMYSTMLKSRTVPASMYYNMTFNDAIERIINDMTKRIV